MPLLAPPADIHADSIIAGAPDRLSPIGSRPQAMSAAPSLPPRTDQSLPRRLSASRTGPGSLNIPHVGQFLAFTRFSGPRTDRGGAPRPRLGASIGGIRRHVATCNLPEVRHRWHGKITLYSVPSPLLRARQGGRIEVVGHADRGARKGAAARRVNWLIAERRATAVADALVALGLPRTAITAEGRGDANRFTPKSTPSAPPATAAPRFICCRPGRPVAMETVSGRKARPSTRRQKGTRFPPADPSTEQASAEPSADGARRRCRRRRAAARAADAPPARQRWPVRRAPPRSRCHLVFSARLQPDRWA